MKSDEDVMEMTQEELQNWIRKEVRKKSEIVEQTAEKLYQILLEKREKLRAGHAKLAQSVADCEFLVQQLYSLMGLDYKDEDSEAETEQQRLPALGRSTMEETSLSRHDARTSAVPQGCGVLVSSVSQCSTPSDSTKPSTLPEQKITLNMKVLAKCKSRKWLPGEIVEIVSKEGGGGFKYKVSLEERRRVLVSGYHLAFENSPALGRLHVGARVVTQYPGDDKSFFYSGIVGELPSRQNCMRFLVFLDDHTPTYVGLSILHLVCRPLEDPLVDIAEDAHRRFIREYLKVWPHPPMAHGPHVDQKLYVEHQGVQRACQVLRIDCSLIDVLFKHSGHKEWIYRGSMRLEHSVTLKRVQQEKAGAGEAKATKPSSGTASAGSGLAGTAVTVAMVNYTPHLCSPACVAHVRPHGPLEAQHKCNPLLVPMTYKFRRPSSIYYYAPCGRTLSTGVQVEDYLRETHCDFLSMDVFSLDPHVSTATTGAKHIPFKVFIPDLAGGRENRAVPCVNEHSDLRPPKLNYRSRRVALDAGLNFVVGCDCVDGCRDSEFCSCRQLTTQSTVGGPLEGNAGYTQKRLHRAVVTGVYECNARCRCDPRTCSNRVAQHGIQVRLQVFMTRDRCWGVRCMDDIPGGAFVCSSSVVPMTTSMRLFDGEDHCYVIAANVEGNVACFLNHSHSPNLFRQYVFVDTHDLRFPWLTFFTREQVKAWTELTCDYKSLKG
ncbi:hypothetical protein NHX12_024112 [Muraenolepis orangiensis]|uniref:Uncharacterized protein n=1 Tax=Muraenolepis orangiensis TaxID=630683 RepID=A0A9Q0EL02_9TELE|nr:hypothetical protein NHX12_024112 [Muraenolepis orangiensis]